MELWFGVYCAVRLHPVPAVSEFPDLLQAIWVEMIKIEAKMPEMYEKRGFLVVFEVKMLIFCFLFVLILEIFVRSFRK